MTERPFVDFEDSVEFSEGEKAARALMMKAVQAGFYDIVDRKLEADLPSVGPLKGEGSEGDPMEIRLLLVDGGKVDPIKRFSITEMMREEIDEAKEDPSNHDGLIRAARHLRLLADEIDAAVEEGRATRPD